MKMILVNRKLPVLMEFGLRTRLVPLIRCLLVLLIVDAIGIFVLTCRRQQVMLVPVLHC